MSKEILNQELTVQISDKDFAILNYMARKLEMSIPDVVRAIIPKIPLEKTPIESPVVPIQKAGPYKIVKDFDRNRLSEILEEMISERKAKTLGEEIKAQLIDDVHMRDTLSGTTEKRLLRWAHPARIDDRTRFASPRAKEICEILFGFVPERE